MYRKIYCISGLGADEKIFSRLDMGDYELVHIPWLRPVKGETIRDYASRMAAGIEDPEPVIIGVSFGGMVAIEIARQLPVSRLFIISSIKTTEELPSWMRLAGRLLLHRILPVRSFRLTEKLDNDRLGVSSPEEKIMVRNYRRNADKIYVDWAINEVLNWKNDWLPSHIIHIHGDRDKMFPLKRITAHHIIKNGTHLMIYNRASEIGGIIREELRP